jgi:hypothetical protein
MCHKVVCLNIQNSTNLARYRRAALSTTVDRAGRNLFALQAGDFSVFNGTTRDYMVARRTLEFDSVSVAYLAGSFEAWNTVKKIYQETLRLDLKSSTRQRLFFPFILINLNLLDDAFSFCKDYVTMIFEDQAHFFHRLNRHRQSSEGDYLYPHEEQSRFHDFLEHRPRIIVGQRSVSGHCTSASILVAVAMIKMRLVAYYASYNSVMHMVFNKTNGGRAIYEVSHLVSEMLTGERDSAFQDKMTPQWEQLQHLLDAIDQCNPFVLKAILNPGPLVSNPPTACIVLPGSISEAYLILMFVGSSWNRIPGGIELLVDRFGSHRPFYNVSSLVSSLFPR